MAAKNTSNSGINHNDPAAKKPKLMKKQRSASKQTTQSKDESTKSSTLSNIFDDFDNFSGPTSRGGIVFQIPTDIPSPINTKNAADNTCTRNMIGHRKSTASQHRSVGKSEREKVAKEVLGRVTMEVVRLLQTDKNNGSPPLTTASEVSLSVREKLNEMIDLICRPSEDHKNGKKMVKGHKKRKLQKEPLKDAINKQLVQLSESMELEQVQPSKCMNQEEPVQPSKCMDQEEPVQPSKCMNQEESEQEEPVQPSKCMDQEELIQLSETIEEEIRGEEETVGVSQETDTLALPTENLLLTFYKALSCVKEQSAETSDKNFEDLEKELSIEEGFCGEKSALWVSGLSKHIKAVHLMGLFSLFGKVQSVKIVADATPPHSRFYAYIMMSRVEDAEDCIKYLNNVQFGENRLCIEKTMTNLIYKEKITIKNEGQIPGCPAGEFPILLQVPREV